MPVRLVPASSGKSIKLDKPVVLIGRNPECDVILRRSQKVSRTHCVLACVENRVFVRDLGSTNGVWVNGQRVERESRVRIGDELSVADVKYHLLNVDQDAPGRNGDNSDDALPGAAAPEKRNKWDRISEMGAVDAAGDRPVALPEQDDSFVVEPSIARLPKIRPDQLAGEDLQVAMSAQQSDDPESGDVIPVGMIGAVPQSDGDAEARPPGAEPAAVHVPAELADRILRDRGVNLAHSAVESEIPLVSADALPVADEDLSEIHDAVPVAHAASEVEIPLLLDDEGEGSSEQMGGDEESILFDQGDSSSESTDGEDGFPLLDGEDDSDDIVPLAPIDQD